MRTLLSWSQNGLLLLGLLGAILLPLAVRGQSQPAGSAAPSAPSSTRPTLQMGSQGTTVSELQSLLKLLGFYTGPVDGVYRETTAAAVSAFQQAAGLQPDGVAGAETWNRLLPAAQPIATTTPAPTPAVPQPAASPSPAPSPTPTTPTPATPGFTPVAPVPSTERPILRSGAQGSDVTQLQERLRAIGVFTGAIDGVFGAETEAAVQQVQRNYNLEPDGIVGPATWEVLLQN